MGDELSVPTKPMQRWLYWLVDNIYQHSAVVEGSPARLPSNPVSSDREQMFWKCRLGLATISPLGNVGGAPSDRKVLQRLRRLLASSLAGCLRNSLRESGHVYCLHRLLKGRPYQRHPLISSRSTWGFCLVFSDLVSDLCVYLEWSGSSWPDYSTSPSSDAWQGLFSLSSRVSSHWRLIVSWATVCIFTQLLLYWETLIWSGLLILTPLDTIYVPLCLYHLEGTGAHPASG